MSSIAENYEKSIFFSLRLFLKSETNLKCVSSHITLGTHRSMFLKLLRCPVTYFIHLFKRIICASWSSFLFIIKFLSTLVADYEVHLEKGFHCCQNCLKKLSKMRIGYFQFIFQEIARDLRKVGPSSKVMENDYALLQNYISAFFTLQVILVISEIKCEWMKQNLVWRLLLVFQNHDHLPALWNWFYIMLFGEQRHSRGAWFKSGGGTDPDFLLLRKHDCKSFILCYK